jgi:hypothetical protein
MQIPSDQRSINNLSSQSRTIAVVAMLLFAFAGLISGFAVGAFIRAGHSVQPSGQTRLPTPPPTNKLTTPTNTPHTQHPLPLGYPKILQVNYMAVADDNSAYTFTVQATDQSNGKRAAGDPMHQTGITCKLWLTKDGNVSANMPTDRLKAADSLSQPFPHEEPGSLDFYDPSTPQTQMCNAKGQATWNYKVATSVEPGQYFLVVLTDWNGVHWSWSWAAVRIKK